jgi:hypothetical protein
MKKFWVMSLVMLLVSCSEETTKEETPTKLNKAVDAGVTEVVTKMQEAHGVKNIDGKEITFSFRDKVYSRYSFNNQYGYSRSGLNEEGEMVIDSWRGDDFKRTINNVAVQITDKEENAYKNSINSVFYFALLPLSLSDPAVNIQLLGDVRVKGKMYTKIKVTFDEEGGGEDFHDVFIYWMNTETNTMDFLAYEYFTEGGGIRFREAFNPREVAGFLFQDYNNFKPTPGIELIDMDKAFEMGEMEQVSEIVLEDIKVN